MGMAASQARYLGLTARKTNCEYEGQQINQARMALANESADYFNQMLTIKVPDCPDSTDYTTLQYSYSDGCNDTVIEDWYQLSNANSEYNYVVDTYHYADVYTGLMKKLQNPEVTFKNEVDAYNEDVTTLKKNKDGSYTLNDEVTYKPLSSYNDNKDMQNAVKDLESEGYLEFPGGQINYDELFGYEDSQGVWHITTKQDLENATSTAGLKPGYVDLSKLGLDLNDTSSWTDDDFVNVTNAMAEEGLVGVSKEDIMQGVAEGAFSTGYASYTTTTMGDVTAYMFESAQRVDAYEAGSGGLIDYSTNYTPKFVGNCKLTELVDNLTLTDETALMQIIADLPESSIAEYITRKPDGTYEYLGAGIYTFEYNGKTQYTTYKDLVNSLTTYDEYGKPIEGQDKLPYYSAAYINTKIEDTSYALLETDGSGRFTSLKLEDESLVYNLHVEEVTDEAAYENAMNQYYHDVHEYEKKIADLNAKTEKIQEQDRTLELRLKQLDTEQNALQTEMEAVKKVISKNVETTFKTFAG